MACSMCPKARERRIERLNARSWSTVPTLELAIHWPKASQVGGSYFSWPGRIGYSLIGPRWLHQEKGVFSCPVPLLSLLPLRMVRISLQLTAPSAITQVCAYKNDDHLLSAAPDGQEKTARSGTTG